MSLNRSLSALFLLALAAGAGAAPGHAQSLLAARGAGLPLDPVDARARALGGVALGLPGFSLSLVNPAGISGIPAPAFLVSFQQDWFDAGLPGEQVDGETARFPLIQAAFPVGERWAVGVGYGAFLDQNWAVERSDTLRFGGRTLPVVDRFASQGGVGRFRVSGAYAISGRLSVGVAADVFSGAVRDTLRRSFVRDTLQTDLLVPSIVGREATYEGVGAAAGVRWTPSDALHLAAALSAGGTLEAEPVEGTGAGRSVSLPATAHLGASGRVAPGMVVALAGTWTGWSTADDDLAAMGGARDALSASAGVEWDSPGREGRPSFPLRLGGRWAELPFRWGSLADGNGFPTERALTGGVGARLAGGAALADVAAERGWRGGGEAALDESYWRLTLSLTLLGR